MSYMKNIHISVRATRNVAKELMGWFTKMKGSCFGKRDCAFHNALRELLVREAHEGDLMENFEVDKTCCAQGTLLLTTSQENSRSLLCKVHSLQES